MGLGAGLCRGKVCCLMVFAPTQLPTTATAWSLAGKKIRTSCCRSCWSRSRRKCRRAPCRVNLLVFLFPCCASAANDMPSQSTLSAPQETTLVHQLFRSIVASQLLCPDCGFISVSFEAYLDLQLEISAYTDTLQDMLEGERERGECNVNTATQVTLVTCVPLPAFTCPERLDANNLYRCAGCQNQVRAHKQLSLFQAPNILTIQLKRFRPGVFGKVWPRFAHDLFRACPFLIFVSPPLPYIQLNQYIQFPKLLNLTTVLTPGSDEGVLEYELYAVLLHLDMYNLTFFGHYICATKAADGTWWLCDDDKVEKISVDDVLKLNAYMVRGGGLKNDRLLISCARLGSSSTAVKRLATWRLRRIHPALLCPARRVQVTGQKHRYRHRRRNLQRLHLLPAPMAAGSLVDPNRMDSAPSE